MPCCWPPAASPPARKIRPPPANLLTASGCSAAFWAHPANAAQWTQPNDPTDDLRAVFSIPDDVVVEGTLLDVLTGTSTDSTSALLREAVAALLNAAHPDVSYGLSAVDVAIQTSNALAGSEANRQALAGTLASNNHAGCPLNSIIVAFGDGGPADLAASADSDSLITTAALHQARVFTQDFADFNFDGEAIPSVTGATIPDDIVPMPNLTPEISACGSFSGANFVPNWACLEYSGPLQMQPFRLELQVDLKLGDDPDVVYNVASFGGVFSFKASPTSSLTAHHEADIVMLDGNGKKLYHTRCVVLTSNPVCSSLDSVDPDLEFQSTPVDRVHTFRFIVRTVENIDPGSTNFYWLAADGFSITTDEVSCRVTLVNPPPNPLRSTEAQDMLAIADASGLFLHEAPTLNANRVQFDPEDDGIFEDVPPIPWGEIVELLTYREFEQTPPTPKQVWYQVSYKDELDITHTGWVAASMEDIDYIANFSSSSINPCASEPNLVEEFTGNLTFTYDREAAARYAIAHAYRNSVPGFNYPITSNVTVRLDDPAIQIDGQPIPFATEVPFADFPYSFISGQSGATGSAVFLSQAIWMGGLPMTHDVSDAQQTVNIQPCGDSLEFDIGGWRYCDDEGAANPETGEATKVWSNHQGIVCYYAEAPSDDRFLCSFNNPNPVNESQNVVIPSTQHGHHMATFNLFDAETRTQLRMEIFEATGSLRSRGGPVLDTYPEIFFGRFIDPNTPDPTHLIVGIEQTQVGDYVFVERRFDSTEGHGYLIVGWGQIMSCPSALGKIWTFEEPITGQYGQLYPNFSNAPANVVPYVVDFPGSVDSGKQTQQARPRPFYCADYNDPDANNPDPVNYQMTSNDGFAFFTFPNAVTIASDQVYTSPDWHWLP